MYQPILATLGYVLSEDKSSVLMIRRDKRPDDLHFGKYNGLGGKLGPAEDVVSGMRREILEEAGLVADALSLRGTISWPGFGKGGADWFGFIFLVDSWHGETHQVQPRGHSRVGAASLGPKPASCGRATSTSCPSCSTATRARSTASCRIRTGGW